MDIIRLYRKINTFLRKNDRDVTLPSSCFFLNEDDVLSLPNNRGDARHPYTRDGLTLWAYSSGYITINESNFYIIPLTLEGKEPYLAFFGGKKNKKGYDYISISGVSDTEIGKTCEKYTIFTPTHVIYLRRYAHVLYASKIGVSKNKELLFTLEAANLSNKKEEIYLSSYFNALLNRTNYESEETKWFRNVTLNDKGALFHAVEDLSRTEHLHNYGILDVSTNGNKTATSSRMYYVGDKNGNLNTSSCLKDGNFKIKKETSQFIDSAVYGDIVKKELNKGEILRSDYRLTIRYNDEDLSTPVYKNNDEDFFELEQEYLKEVKHNKNKLLINFKNAKGVPDKLLNNFIHQVIGQVDYCSKAKNSSLMLLGIRDISQMLDASLIWNHKLAKERILTIFNFLDPSGRAPRQTSIPKHDEKNILMDNREFIDQGQWMISTVHRYLCYTEDYSILKEKCGFCELVGKKEGRIIDEKSSLLDHLIRIIDFLVDNIDEKTGCLKTLYGDWNDAVDGLGSSKSENRFGNGVSVMATFHLYKNLNEMADILKRAGLDAKKYERINEELLVSIKKECIKDGHILHGWGEDQSFFVGSSNDIDGRDRYSSTSYSFYVMSGVYNVDPSYKDLVMNAYRHLDSKYGVKTFSEPFYRESGSEVGRIVNLPVGTAENSATYIHAGMFMANALMMMNEGEEAYNQILKLIPITHEFISTSPFVMPNSYGYNPELGIDGESMNDWYTGSSNTLLKVIVDSLLGIRPKYIDELELRPVKVPVEEINAEITVKNKRLKIHYSTINKEKYIKVNNEIISGNIVNLKDIKEKIVNIELSL